MTPQFGTHIFVVLYFFLFRESKQACQPGQYQDANTNPASCVNCPISCSLCTAADMCTSCKTSYKFYLPLNRSCSVCTDQNAELPFKDQSSGEIKCVSRPLIKALSSSSIFHTGSSLSVSLGCSDPQNLLEASDVKTVWMISSNETLANSITVNEITDLIAKNGPKNTADYSSEVVTLYGSEKMNSINKGQLNVTMIVKGGLRYKFTYFCINKWDVSATSTQSVIIDETNSFAKRIYVGITFPGVLGRSLENRVLCVLEKMFGLSGKKLIFFTEGQFCSQPRFLQSDSDPNAYGPFLLGRDLFNMTYFLTIMPDLTDTSSNFYEKIKGTLNNDFATKIYNITGLNISAMHYFSEGETIGSEGKYPDFTYENKYANVTRADLFTSITMKDRGYLFFAVVAKLDGMYENYTISWDAFITGKANNSLKYLDYFISVYCEPNQQVDFDISALDSKQDFFSFLGTMGFDRTFTKSPIVIQIFTTDRGFNLEWSVLCILAVSLIILF